MESRGRIPLSSGQLRRRRDRSHARRQRRRTVIGAGASAVAIMSLGVIAVDAPGRHHRRHVAIAAAAPAAARVHDLSPAPADAVGEPPWIRHLAERMPYVSVAGHRHREVALTFDDGPGPYTEQVLRVLRRAHAPATFFQVGVMIHSFPAAERKLVADHQVLLGDHTETHPVLSRLSPADQERELSDAAANQRVNGAPSPYLFRPPYGAFNRQTLAVVRRLHMLTVLWTIDSQDYRRPGVPAIVMRVMSGIRPGAIVLMHDAGGDRSQTVAALPTIIKQLRARHFRLVTVAKLLQDDPPSRHQPPAPSGVG